MADPIAACSAASTAVVAAGEFLDNGRWLKLLLFAGGIWIVGILIRLQHGASPIDFKRLLTDEHGATSPTSIFQTGAFLATTWGYIVTANGGHLEEWHLLTYGALWSSTRLITKLLDMRHELARAAAGLPPQPQQPPKQP